MIDNGSMEGRRPAIMEWRGGDRWHREGRDNSTLGTDNEGMEGRQTKAINMEMRDRQ